MHTDRKKGKKIRAKERSPSVIKGGIVVLHQLSSPKQMVNF